MTHMSTQHMPLKKPSAVITQSSHSHHATVVCPHLNAISLKGQKVLAGRRDAFIHSVFDLYSFKTIQVFLSLCSSCLPLPLRPFLSLCSSCLSFPLCPFLPLYPLSLLFLTCDLWLCGTNPRVTSFVNYNLGRTLRFKNVPQNILS